MNQSSIAATDHSNNSNSNTSSNPNGSSSTLIAPDSEESEETPPCKVRSFVEIYETCTFALFGANPTCFKEALVKKDGEMQWKKS